MGNLLELPTQGAAPAPYRRYAVSCFLQLPYEDIVKFLAKRAKVCWVLGSIFSLPNTPPCWSVPISRQSYFNIIEDNELASKKTKCIGCARTNCKHTMVCGE